MSRMTRPSSAGAAASRSVAASASTTSPSAPRSSSVSTRTPVAGTPNASSCPWRTRWSTAARMSGTASSRSPRRALSRATYTLTIGKSPELCSTSLTSARSVFRGHDPHPFGGAPAQRPACIGRRSTRGHRQIVRQPAASISGDHVADSAAVTTFVRATPRDGGARHPAWCRRRGRGRQPSRRRTGRTLSSSRP